MGVGFGGFVGQTPLGAAKVYHITSGFRANVFLGDLTQMGVFLWTSGSYQYHTPHLPLQSSSGESIYTTDWVYYHMTTRDAFGWMDGRMDETNMMGEDETTRGDEIG